MLPFSKLNKIFSGYFDPVNIFVFIKVNEFRGDLTEIPAVKRFTRDHSGVSARARSLIWTKYKAKTTVPKITAEKTPR